MRGQRKQGRAAGRCLEGCRGCEVVRGRWRKVEEDVSGSRKLSGGSEEVDWRSGRWLEAVGKLWREPEGSCWRSEEVPGGSGNCWRPHKELGHEDVVGRSEKVIWRSEKMAEGQKCGRPEGSWESQRKMGGQRSYLEKLAEWSGKFGSGQKAWSGQEVVGGQRKMAKAEKLSGGRDEVVGGSGSCRRPRKLLRWRGRKKMSRPQEVVEVARRCSVVVGCCWWVVRKLWKAGKLSEVSHKLLEAAGRREVVGSCGSTVRVLVGGRSKLLRSSEVGRSGSFVRET
ncbi:hypothetical protein FNV43_RR20315 [Rhamnella rubrinervis]|uniref:Uncharacterized protein n=1 Tax=Rhamnella rubrinervis TaxID=2594499 RepID=A0A8K0GT97_9ROSA|nr:hypothetical protein FNV43_RR20315 [Rhamnella rubrinervis]